MILLLKNKFKKGKIDKILYKKQNRVKTILNLSIFPVLFIFFFKDPYTKMMLIVIRKLNKLLSEMLLCMQSRLIIS